MRSQTPATDAFDAFYRDTRDRLMTQALALTGDPTSARGGVRHAFIVAWHHWRKVSALPDPEAYVRPIAWNHALRLSSARVFRRVKGLDPEVAATLESLVKLPVQQRKVLLLNQLSSLTLPELAVEVGLPQATAEQELQTATAQFSLHREASSAALPLLLAPLGDIAAASRWPRGSIIRRSGATRRRGHTVLGAAAALSATLVAGTLVSVGGDHTPRLTQEELTVRAQVIKVADPEPPKPRLTPGRMLSNDQVRRLNPKATWAQPRTHVNTAGDGILFDCQAERYADPDGLAALARQFRDQPTKKTRAATSVVQFSELSADKESAENAYGRVLAWLADCASPSAYLESTRELTGVGDEAMQFTVRRWASGPAISQIGVARSGQVTTTLQITRAGTHPVSPRTAAALLAAAINAQCGEPGTERCAAPPVSRTQAPLPAPNSFGMLTAADLPQPGQVAGSWVGTTPATATVNLAASRCDNTSFIKRPFTSSLTRTFLVPGANLPSEFGLTESIGLAPDVRRATDKMNAIVAAMSSCEEDKLGIQVTKLAETSEDKVGLAAWRVVTEISDEARVNLLVAVLRDRNRVAQVGFIPTGEATWTDEQFLTVAERALIRLHTATRKHLDAPAQ